MSCNCKDGLELVSGMKVRYPCVECRGKLEPYTPPDLPIPTSEGKKFDDGKLRMDLIPPEVIEELAKVLTFGAIKYDDNNWQQIEDKRFRAAAMRHKIAREKGEIFDSESNLRHRTHELCNIAFLLWKEINNEK